MGEVNPNRIPRQDILATVNSLIPISKGYIADICHPPLSVFQISGTRPAQLYNNSGTAQTGRAHGGTITGVNDRTANLDTFSCTEILSRQTIDVRDSPMFGGVAGQELALGVSGIRETSDKIEAAVVTNVQANPVDNKADPFTGIRNAVEDLTGFGDVILVGSYKAFDKLRQNAVIIDRMKNTGVSLVGLTPREIASAQLAAIFGALEVHEAKGVAATQWDQTIITALVKVDAAYDPMSVPQVGRRYVYTWTADGVNQTMVIEQGYDITVRNDLIDFVTMTDDNTINPAFQKVLSIA